jgi:hypothetical protein
LVALTDKDRKYINILWGKKVKFFIVKLVDALSDNWALKG